MRIVYNYHFVSSYNKGVYMLVEGGSQMGTMTSGGWLFDGQIFRKPRNRWDSKPNPQSMILIKKTS